MTLNLSIDLLMQVRMSQAEIWAGTTGGSSICRNRSSVSCIISSASAPLPTILYLALKSRL